MKVDGAAKMYSEIRFERRVLPPRFSLSNRLDVKLPSQNPQVDPRLTSSSSGEIAHPPVKPEIIRLDDPVPTPPRGEGLVLDQLV